jgi:hypothetical protein
MHGSMLCPVEAGHLARLEMEDSDEEHDPSRCYDLRVAATQVTQALPTATLPADFGPSGSDTEGGWG